jgi:hypothetical protein
MNRLAKRGRHYATLIVGLDSPLDGMMRVATRALCALTEDAAADT